MDTQVSDSLLGTLVGGRYRVRGRLSGDGTASVYTAADERLGRTVTVTIATPPPGSPGPLTPRFVDRPEAVARLTHPNLVATYDQGTHQGLPFLVREHVHGHRLRDILTTRRWLTPDEALAIAEQTLAGLAAAHRAGLAHGTLMPEKIQVVESPSGGIGNLVDAVAKLGDLGLPPSRRPGVAHGDDPAVAAAYVAPDLVTGGLPDPRSDVYSAGIILFEMLTGRVPYDTGSPAEVAWQHVDRVVPPPSSYRTDLPPVLDDLVGRATHRDPGSRPSDAGALLAEVRAARQRIVTGAVAGPSADSTVVMAAVTERPAWARLPANGAGRHTATATCGVRDSDYRRNGTRERRPPVDPTAAARQRTALLAAAAAVGVLLLLGGWWFGFGRWMPAPDLLAKAEQDAMAEAEALGLRVTFDAPRHSDHVAEGMVLAQDPTDRITRGGTIVLTLSLGPDILLVPDVIGAEMDVARRQLEALGLVVRDGEPGFSNTVPAGRVLAVDPEAGTEVRPGDEVVLSASEGRAPIDVPHLIGLHINEASNELQRLGLQAEVVEVESQRPAGEVLHQDPGTGAGVEPGHTVRLEISEGPATIPVPHVIGQRCQDAERHLQEAGFEVQRDGRGRNRDRVVLQSPSAGTGLPPGSEVRIWCGL
jgi:eukaryotic-like serine/threonine-protein kinase